jgi:hypothetical protein
MTERVLLVFNWYEHPTASQWTSIKHYMFLEYRIQCPGDMEELDL